MEVYSGFLRLSAEKLLCFQMATDMERFVSFEETYYDQYDYYNLLEFSCHACGKGRSKREIELNTNRHSPSGHERKIAEKFHNSEIKRRRTKSSSC
ncbi:nuclear protein 1-like [Hippoglossus hippoglossus]|uniref:nuclear protein 1-like n=1 Tax=Hippoglossus hippoglossus TaxID=8267 RepID=UPI00148DF3D7|nr:nuclear protein 1-like [Hippoglossus hippoglossus]